MKKLLLTLVLGLATLIPQARAVGSLPFFGSLRAEVLEQLDLATNGVATPDKKLVTALKKALTTIDKTKPTYATGAKAIGTLAKGLNRTTVSNEFAASFESVINIYISALTDEENDLADRLVTAFPSKTKTSALTALDRLLSALDGANTNNDVIVAAKYLGTAAKGLTTATKLTEKAEDAPAPANSFTANVSASNQGTFTYKPILASVTAGYDPGSHILNIQSFEIKTSGTSVESIDVQHKTIGILVNVPSDGPHTYNLSTDSNLIYYSFSHSHGGTIEFAEVYAADTGTVTLTFDSATKLVYGEFNFTGNGANNGTLSATVSGSFSIHYIP